MAECGACGEVDIMNELAGCGHALCNQCLARSSSNNFGCCPLCEAAGKGAGSVLEVAAAVGEEVLLVHELPISQEQHAAALNRRISDREDRRTQYLLAFLRLRTVFVHVPKTAGTSIESVLFPAVGKNRSQHAPVGYWRERVEQGGGDWNSMFKFAVVRDPYDRFVSAYSYWLAGGLAGQAVDLAFSRRVRQCSGICAFVDYLHSVHLSGAWDDNDIQGYDGSCPTQFRPQTHFLGLDGPAASRLDYSGVAASVDFIGRYERLDKDFRLVLAQVNSLGRLGCGSAAAEVFDEEAPLPHRRVSIHVRAQLPEELAGSRTAMDKLYEVYEHDFRAFGYPRR